MNIELTPRGGKMPSVAPMEELVSKGCFCATEFSIEGLFFFTEQRQSWLRGLISPLVDLVASPFKLE
jgi:hypothetical protein